MSSDFDFIGPDDKPALLALSNPEHQSLCESVLLEKGFKVNKADNHEEFQITFGRYSYLVVVIDPAFGGDPTNNPSLISLQKMPMPQRRHSFLVLVGDEFQSFNTMQAFAQSVHVVINPNELVKNFPRIIEVSLPDNDRFMHMYRELSNAASQGK